VSKGWATAEQRAKAKFPKFAKYRPTKTSMAGPNGYLLDGVQREMLDRGYSQSDLDLGGYRIVTTFDKDAQQAAVEAVDGSAPYDRDRFLRLGVASVRPGTGEVVAMYGGSDYLENQYSDADQATAMAGSTFKPFALAAALEEGIAIDSTWDGSSPRTIRGYRVPNQGGQSFGTITLQRATEMSVNTVYVDVAGTVGHEKVRQAAIRAGVPEQTLGLVADPTTVLGTSSPRALDMANAYATFAARGIKAQPTMIKEIRRNQGSVEHRLEPRTTRVFSEDVADEVNYVLRKVVTQGTGFAARGLGRPAAGKTGTTDSNLSAWFVGYTPELSTAVMMARSSAKGDSVSLSGTGGMSSVSGGSYPARIWTSFMSGALSGLPVSDFVDPSGRSDRWGESYASPSTSSGSPSPSATKKTKTPTAAPPRPPSGPATPVPTTAPPAPATPTPSLSGP
ncbi:MAG: transglycosylase domain-containing protein, partial [Candidatus Nanopelagicales bacterium]|nr:transglycosylase domain-containing protein [Candidatus Nanopelagicales bacterium]